MSESEEGAGEALPPGWTREFSKSQQRHYFFHKASSKSVWRLEDLPALDALLKQQAQAPPSSSSSSQAQHAQHQHEQHGTAKRGRAGSEGEGEGEGAGRAHDEGGEQLSSKRAHLLEDDAARGDPRKRKRRVCIIVPFRDLHVEQQRQRHLEQFVPHMEEFLADNEGVESFHVLVVEQSDDGRKFNRGKLLNVGFRHAVEAMHEQRFDSFIFHDVDLLPQATLKQWYATYPECPLHIARCWGRYNNNENYFGGIVAFRRKDFEDIDGFPNTFWGWGGEDDELQQRVQERNIRVNGPQRKLSNAIVDLEQMDLKTKLETLRKTDWKCNVKWEARDEYKKYRAQAREIPWWGLRGVNHKVLASAPLGLHATRLTVDVGYNFNSDGSEHWANRKTSFD
jgi:hypothetical protein